MIDPVFLRQALQSAALVVPLAVFTVLGAWGGSELDIRLESTPFISLALAGLGFTAGLVQLFRGLRRIRDEQNPHEPPAPPPP